MIARLQSSGASWIVCNWVKSSNAFESRVRVPEPVLRQEHILVTRCVQQNQKPVRSFVDAKSLDLDIKYLRILGSIRMLYWVARLVHGNINEYTVLAAASWYSRYWLTDFGHALDRDHVDSLEVIEKDLMRINAFFSKHGLKEATAGKRGLLPVDKAMALILLEEDPRLCDKYRACAEYVMTMSIRRTP